MRIELKVLKLINAAYLQIITRQYTILQGVSGWHSDRARTSMTRKSGSVSVCTISVGALVPIQSLSWTLPGVKRPQREADHTSHTDHTDPFRFTSTPPRLLGKVFRHNENFTLPYPVTS